MGVVTTDTLQDKTAVVFIHGTPGSADAFYEYMKDTSLRKKFTLISLDRIGYGFSNYGQPETSIQKQAEGLQKIITKYKNIIVVGHSYGGPIAVEVLYQNKNVQSCLLIAPTLFPHKEKFYGISKIITSRIGRLMFSKALYVASEEKVNHEASLNECKSRWHNIKKKITYIHSTDDKLVPYQLNYDYLSQAFPHAYLDTLTLQEGNHFLPWNNHQLIRHKLLELGNTQ